MPLLIRSPFLFLYSGTSVCDGDSGGGMFFQRNGAFYIRGIVSVGITKMMVSEAKCDPTQYSVFTDVAIHLDWIKQHLS